MISEHDSEALRIERAAERGGEMHRRAESLSASWWSIPLAAVVVAMILEMIR